MQRKTVKARVIDWAMVAAICAIISLALMIYQTRYKDYNIATGDTLVIEFSASGSSKATSTMSPSKGTLYYGWAQTKGNSKCKYQLSYKKTSSNSWKVLADGKKFSRNDRYVGEYKVTKTNGKTDYNLLCTKQAEKSTSSTLKIDWLIE